MTAFYYLIVIVSVAPGNSLADLEAVTRCLLHFIQLMPQEKVWNIKNLVMLQNTYDMDIYAVVYVLYLNENDCVLHTRAR